MRFSLISAFGESANAIFYIRKKFVQKRLFQTGDIDPTLRYDECVMKII